MLMFLLDTLKQLFTFFKCTWSFSELLKKNEIRKFCTKEIIKIIHVCRNTFIKCYHYYKLILFNCRFLYTNIF